MFFQAADESLHATNTGIISISSVAYWEFYTQNMTDHDLH